MSTKNILIILAAIFLIVYGLISTFSSDSTGSEFLVSIAGCIILFKTFYNKK